MKISKNTNLNTINKIILNIIKIFEKLEIHFIKLY